MSINRNAQIRFLALDKCLRNNGRLWTWKNLLDAVNEVLGEEINPKTKLPIKIGKTQIYEDLKDLEYRVYKAPIKRTPKGKLTYYSYEDPNFSIQNAPLNETEINQIKSTLQLFTRFQGLPDFSFIDEMIPAINEKLGLVSVEREVMSFENNLQYEGSKFITPLFNAIVNKRALEIDYQDFKTPLPNTIYFHPYYLKQYNSRWFVFGYNEFTKNTYWNMALDRIKTIKELETKYIETNINWFEYFDDFIGVTKKNDDILQTIKLWFSPIQAPYVITKPLHPTQTKIKNTEEGLEITINVVPNYELEMLILSFGEKVKVLSPESLQKAIYYRIKDASKLYK